jgi:hypothetical protein
LKAKFSMILAILWTKLKSILNLCTSGICKRYPVSFWTALLNLTWFNNFFLMEIDQKYQAINH